MLTSLKNIIATIFLILSALSLCITLTIFSSGIFYRVAISWFNLDTLSGLTEGQLMSNFQTILNYLLSPRITELEMPYFASSENGLFHFEEVKVLVQSNLIISFFSVIIIIALIIWIRKLQFPYSFKYYFTIAAIFPLGLLFFIVIAFDQLFLLFHELLFDNDHWLFNPLTDPVITVLPEELFMIYFLIAILFFEAIVFITRQFSLRTRNL